MNIRVALSPLECVDCEATDNLTEILYLVPATSRNPEKGNVGKCSGLLVLRGWQNRDTLLFEG